MIAPLSHAEGPDTEKSAARSVVAPAAKLRALVLDVIREREAGVTDDEGARILRSLGHRNADRLTFGRRRHELVLDGLVESTEHRRPTPTGRSAVVWRAAPRLSFPAGTVDRALAD